MVTSSVEDCRDSDTALEQVIFFNVNNNININIKLIRSPRSLFIPNKTQAAPGSTARTRFTDVTSWKLHRKLKRYKSQFSHFYMLVGRKYQQSTSKYINYVWLCQTPVDVIRRSLKNKPKIGPNSCARCALLSLSLFWL